MHGPVLTLLARAWCHLCDEMRDALVPLARAHGATVAEIDVDADPDLEARYGDRVPVLLLGPVADDVVLCHYRLDERAVAQALAKPA
jgi:thiol-disulfide isomerase/thioredoxin